MAQRQICIDMIDMYVDKCKLYTLHSSNFLLRLSTEKRQIGGTYLQPPAPHIIDHLREHISQLVTRRNPSQRLSPSDLVAPICGLCGHHSPQSREVYDQSFLAGRLRTAHSVNTIIEGLTVRNRHNGKELLGHDPLGLEQDLGEELQP